MLPRLLTDKTVRTNVEVESWQEVVTMTGDLLHAAGLTEPQYTQAMQQLIDDLGPYLVIAPGIALLHARPEEGVIRLGLSLITLMTPVSFGHSTNDPVWLAIGLAAEDSNTHIDLMRELALILSDGVTLDRIKVASTPSEVLEAIQQSATIG